MEINDFTTTQDGSSSEYLTAQEDALYVSLSVIGNMPSLVSIPDDGPFYEYEMLPINMASTTTLAEELNTTMLENGPTPAKDVPGVSVQDLLSALSMFTAKPVMALQLYEKPPPYDSSHKDILVDRHYHTGFCECETISVTDKFKEVYAHFHRGRNRKLRTH